MAVNVEVGNPADTLGILEATDPRMLSGIETAGLYKGDITELSGDELEVLSCLADIKNTAIGYVQGSAFLQEKLYPPEPWSGHNETTHEINVSSGGDGEPTIHRTAVLQTAAGKMMVDVASKASRAELEQLDAQLSAARNSGVLNNRGDGFSDWYKQAELARMRSGIETPAERKRAVVTFGLIASDEIFELNGSVQKRLNTGESCVIDGMLLDPEAGVVDVRVFEAVLNTLEAATGTKK